MKKSIKFFLKLEKEAEDVCFLTSFGKQGWQDIIAWDAQDNFICKKEDDYEKLKKFVDKNLKLKRKIIGFISYDIGNIIYGIKQKKSDLPIIQFRAYDHYVLFANNKLCIISKDKKYIIKVNEINKKQISHNIKGQTGKFKPEISRKQYGIGFAKIKKYIQNGDIYQANYTYKLKTTTNIESRQLFVKTIQTNKPTYGAYIEGKNFDILSASPEQFIKVKNGIIETSPIKGTAPRGNTEYSDKKNKLNLLQSNKEACELNMITDLLRNDLGKICKTGTVKLEKNRQIKKYKTLWHTYSKIKGALKKELHPMNKHPLLCHRASKSLFLGPL